MSLRGLKNKKQFVVILLAVVTLVAVGATLAINGDQMIFKNIFGIADYKTEFIEVFESPNDWTPCDETPKTVFAKNNSSVNVVVRLSYEEYWRARDGETELGLERDGLKLAVINFQNEEDWELRDDGWYYYKDELKPGETTSSLFKSVKLDCSANFAGENDSCSETDNGRVCTKRDDEYDGAKYHLKITVQTIAAADKDEWTSDDSDDEDEEEDNGRPRLLLYDAVASQTRGTDRNVVGLSGNSLASTTGVYTKDSTKNDTYKVYYYRGNTQNNYAIWGKQCWRIMRTTGSGGTKLLYAGTPQTSGDNMTCVNSEANAAINGRAYRFNQDDNSISDVGYMYGERLVPQKPNINNNTYVISSNNVSYANGAYTLGSTSNTRFGSVGKFMCPDGRSTSCSTVWTLWNGVYLEMSGGELVDDLYEKAFASIHDSVVKNAIDTWFETNLLKYESRLEDTVFCNDRKILHGFYADSGYTGAFLAPYVSASVGIWGTTMDNDLSCPELRDSYTRYTSSGGNGKLKHSVGLPTVHEVEMAGSTNAYYGSGGSLGFWTMSPFAYSLEENAIAMTSGYGGSNVAGYKNMVYGVRPVVSVNHDAFIYADAGSNGTASNPYMVK